MTQLPLTPRKPLRSTRQIVAERLAGFALRNEVRNAKRRRAKRARAALREVQAKLDLVGPAPERLVVVRRIQAGVPGETCVLECGHELQLSERREWVACVECAVNSSN